MEFPELARFFKSFYNDKLPYDRKPLYHWATGERKNCLAIQRSTTFKCKAFITLGIFNCQTYCYINVALKFYHETPWKSTICYNGIVRKTSLALGIIYLLWSTWQYFSVTKVQSLYAQFNAQTPSYQFLLPIILFIFGTVLIGIFTDKVKNKTIYKALVALGIFGIASYLIYIMYSGTMANRQIEQILEEVR